MAAVEMGMTGMNIRQGACGVGERGLSGARGDDERDEGDRELHYERVRVYKGVEGGSWEQALRCSELGRRWPDEGRRERWQPLCRLFGHTRLPRNATTARPTRPTTNMHHAATAATHAFPPGTQFSHENASRPARYRVQPKRRPRNDCGTPSPGPRRHTSQPGTETRRNATSYRHRSMSDSIRYKGMCRLAILR